MIIQFQFGSLGVAWREDKLGMKLDETRHAPYTADTQWVCVQLSEKLQSNLREYLWK
jgi:hypothetical protein